MPRPCFCDKTILGGDFVRGRDCARCWLWHNKPDSPEVRIWKGEKTNHTAKQASPPRIELPCHFVGQDSGPKGWHVCDHPDEPLGAVVCSCQGCGPNCPGYDKDGKATPRRAYRLARTRVGRRHLSYHVYPVRGSRWRDYVDRIVRSWSLFDGNKVIAVVTDGSTDDWTEVLGRVPRDAEVFTLPNDPKLGETLTWEPRWVRVLEGAEDHDAVLYGHAKGVTRSSDVCYEWSSLLHDLSLDHWEETESLLRRHPVVGSLRKHGNGFPPPSGGDYHFSGTFYWLRVGEFRKRDWRRIAQHRWGVESWPSEQYDISESGSLFGEFKNTGQKGDWPEFGVYDSRESWDRNVLSLYERWNAIRDPNGIPIDVVSPTLFSRSQNLIKVQSSLDCLVGYNSRWHVIESPGNTWGGRERNLALEEISRDSWVYNLDDDNTIHPAFPGELRYAILKHPEAVGFVFRQLRPDGRVRLPAVIADKVGQIDTAQYVFKRSAIGDIRWGNRRAADFDFFRDVEARNAGKVVAIDQPACWYNSLRR